MATILIMDDQPSNRTYLVTLLGYQGHRLLEAADGAEGLAVAKAEQPDLIITDILMPTMDGYEFVRRLRADPALASAPIIFYTAYYLEHEAQALAQSCGVAYVMQRPAELETILEVVETVLGLSPPVPAPPSAETFDQEHLRLLTDKLAQKVDEQRVTNLKLDALIEISLQLASERDPRRLLGSFCYTARELIGAGYATVSILSEDEQTLDYFLTSGLDMETVAQAGFPIPRPDLLTRLLTERQSYRLYNPSGDPETAGFPPSFPPIHSLLAAPIVSPNQVYGWLCLVDKVGAATFNEAEERLATILAALVGRIYENSRLYSELQRHAEALEREVAERQQAQEALQRREQEFRSLAENAPDIIARFDRRLRHLYVNHRVEATTGLPPSTFLGRTNREMGLPEQVVDYWDQELNRVFETGQPIIIEFEFPTPEGPSFFEARLIPEAGDAYASAGSSSVETVLVINRDITERKQTEKALLRSVQELEMAYQQSVIYARELNAEILERRRMGEALQRRAEEAETLRQAGAAIVATLDRAEAIERILAQLERVVPYDSASVQLLRPGYLEIVGGRGWPWPEAGRGLRLLVPGHNPNTWVIEQRQPYLLGNVRAVYPTFGAENPTPIQSWLGVPLITRDQVTGMLTLDSGQPDYFTPDHLRLAVAFADQVAIALENVRLYEAEQQARQLAETLSTASLALAKYLDLDYRLETLLDYVSQLVPYDSASVFLLETEARLVVRVIRGYEQWTDPELVRQAVFDARTNPTFSLILTTHQSLLIPDTTAAHSGWERRPGGEHVRNWLGVPLVASGRVIGIYSLDKAEPGFFTGEHQHLVEALAAQAAVAIQNARLFVQVREARQRLEGLSLRLLEVQENERRSIARELHDEFGQVLTGLKLVLEMSTRLPADQIGASLGEAQALVHNLMEQVHELSLNLRPAMLDDLGLLPTLLWHFDRFTQLTQIRVAFNEVGLKGRRFAPEIETAAYRLVQEALTNVARHAGVSEVKVELRVTPDTLELQIKDEGGGFNPQIALAAGTSTGLSGMRERVELLGGQFTVESAPGAGALVQAELPLRSQRERNDDYGYHHPGG